MHLLRRRRCFEAPFIVCFVAIVFGTACTPSGPIPSVPSRLTRADANSGQAIELDALQADCERDHAVACLAFAEFLYWKDLNLRRQERLDAAEKACSLGEPDGCAIAGVATKFSTAGEARAHELLTQGCTGGSYMACYAVKEWWPEEVLPKVERVVPLLEASCQRGVALHCTIAGVLVVSGYGHPADPIRGLKLLQTACDLDGLECWALAAFHATSDLAGSDPLAAPAFCVTYARAEAARAESPTDCHTSFRELVEDTVSVLTSR